MEQNKSKNYLLGLLVAFLAGIFAFLIAKFLKVPHADPLLVGLIVGMILKLLIGSRESLTPGLVLAPSIFIPIGAILYGAINLNFVEFAKVNGFFIVLTVLIILVYFLIILALGRILKQKEEITYLTATGSAVCGASAIAITSQALEAEPDDVSISLVSVFLTACFGLFILFPFLISLFNLDNYTFALLSGTTLQFTGFVKGAVATLPKDLKTLALAVKAVRYLALLIAIPLFSSFLKKRVYIPWFLWAFLGGGLIFSLFPQIAKILNPIFKPLLDVLWTVAMTAIGLNADVRALFSDNGMKALLMAFLGFFGAILVFFLGIPFIK
jgi:uncharacterized integral membrane protein (TIGR00698 family)